MDVVNVTCFDIPMNHGRAAGSDSESNQLSLVI